MLDYLVQLCDDIRFSSPRCERKSVEKHEMLEIKHRSTIDELFDMFFLKKLEEKHRHMFVEAKYLEKASKILAKVDIFDQVFKNFILHSEQKPKVEQIFPRVAKTDDINVCTSCGKPKKDIRNSICQTEIKQDNKMNQTEIMCRKLILKTACKKKTCKDPLVEAMTITTPCLHQKVLRKNHMEVDMEESLLNVISLESSHHDIDSEAPHLKPHHRNRRKLSKWK